MSRKRPLPWTLHQARDVTGARHWELDLEVRAGDVPAIMRRRGRCWGTVTADLHGNCQVTGIPVTVAEATAIAASGDPLGVLASGAHGARPWPWLTARALTVAEMMST